MHSFTNSEILIGPLPSRRQAHHWGYKHKEATCVALGTHHAVMEIINRGFKSCELRAINDVSSGAGGGEWP